MNIDLPSAPKMPFVLPIGTRTRLASGGPIMLVVDFDFDKGLYCCAWRDNDQVGEGWFVPATLDFRAGSNRHHLYGR